MFILALRPRSWLLRGQESLSGSDSELAASNKCPMFNAIVNLVAAAGVGLFVSQGFGSGVGFGVPVGLRDSEMLLISSTRFGFISSREG